MKILLSNDDGVHAEGIMAMYQELSEIADVTVVAPDRNRSGASNSLTLTSPLRVKTLESGFISVEGTPTDCVHLAVTGMLEKKFDMVVSGANHGANLGDDILYSGTVAAAMEGRYLGYPAIAVSLAGEKSKHLISAAVLTKKIVTSLEGNALPSNTILNVNVPDLPLNEITGFSIARLGTRHIAEPTIKAEDPSGKTIYWIGAAGPEQDSGPGTDFHAIHDKKVSITPLQLDMTHYKMFDQVSAWVDKINL